MSKQNSTKNNKLLNRIKSWMDLFCHDNKRIRNRVIAVNVLFGCLFIIAGLIWNDAACYLPINYIFCLMYFMWLFLDTQVLLQKKYLLIELCISLLLFLALFIFVGKTNYYSVHIGMLVVGALLPLMYAISFGIMKYVYKRKYKKEIVLSIYNGNPRDWLYLTAVLLLALLLSTGIALVLP